MSNKTIMSGISVGPWTATLPYMEGHETLIQIEACHVIVGEVYAGDEPEGIANARLIGAAPRIVEAALEVLEWYDRDGSVGGIVEPMEQLRAALGG